MMNIVSTLLCACPVCFNHGYHLIMSFVRSYICGVAIEPQRNKQSGGIALLVQFVCILSLTNGTLQTRYMRLLRILSHRNLYHTTLLYYISYSWIICVHSFNIIQAFRCENSEQHDRRPEEVPTTVNKSLRGQRSVVNLQKLYYGNMHITKFPTRLTTTSRPGE